MRHLAILGVVFATFYVVQSQFIMPEFCTLPIDGGTGSDVIILLHYDTASDKCYPFKYTGLGGNANRFGNERECMRNCSALAESVYPMNEKESCHFPKLHGECVGRYLRFYYDPVHEKCKTFQFTGCVGNGNRFLDAHQCNATCFGIKDEGDGPEDEEPDTPVALILGIVFGLVGAIIIIVVIVMAMKNKKTPKDIPSKTKDAQADSPLKEDGIEMA